MALTWLCSIGNASIRLVNATAGANSRSPPLPTPGGSAAQITNIKNNERQSKARKHTADCNCSDHRPSRRPHPDQDPSQTDCPDHPAPSAPLQAARSKIASDHLRSRPVPSAPELPPSVLEHSEYHVGYRHRLVVAVLLAYLVGVDDQVGLHPGLADLSGGWGLEVECVCVGFASSLEPAALALIPPQ